MLIFQGANFFGAISASVFCLGLRWCNFVPETLHFFSPNRILFGVLNVFLVCPPCLG